MLSARISLWRDRGASRGSRARRNWLRVREEIERAQRDCALPERKAVIQAVVAEIRVRDRGHIQRLPNRSLPSLPTVRIDRFGEAEGNRPRLRALARTPVLKTGGPTRRPDASAPSIVGTGREA